MKVRKPRASLRAAITSFLECNGCGYATNVMRPDCPKCGADLPRPTARDRKQRAKPRHFEDAHQAVVIEWCQKQVCVHPDLEKVYHVPNGGARNGFEGKRLQEQGVVAGVLDLNLDVARGGYFGLRIELKATKAELGEKPRVSKDQKKRIDWLVADNYCVAVCEGADAAIAVLKLYVTQPRTPPGRPTFALPPCAHVRPIENPA